MSKVFPRGFRPSGGGGIPLTHRCDDCPRPEPRDEMNLPPPGCPGLGAIGQAFIIKYYVDRGEPIDEGTARFIAQDVIQRGERIGCEDQTLMKEGKRDLNRALAYYPHKEC